MANDLPDDFVGAAVVAFGTAALAVQSQGAPVDEGLAELEIALLAQAELLGGAGGAQAVAFAFDEHGEFAGDFVVGTDRQGASGADELEELEIEPSHGTPGEEEREAGRHREPC